MAQVNNGADLEITIQDAVAAAITATANTGDNAAPKAGIMLIDVASGSVVRNPNGAVSALSSANYSVTGCEFRLLQEMPPKTQLANMDYCFTSYDLFNDTIPQSTTRHNQEITSVSSKAMALFTTFEDQRYNSGIQSLGSNSYFTGIAADAPGFNINSVVYFINNKLYPLRAYDPKRNHDKVIQVNDDTSQVPFTAAQTPLSHGKQQDSASLTSFPAQPTQTNGTEPGSA